MRRLLLFARYPRLGEVKTRLVPALGAPRVLVLYRAFLADQIRFLRSFEDRCEIEIWWDTPPEDASPLPTGHESIRSSVQGDGDLGRRLHRAFKRSLRKAPVRTVVLGSDSPTLPSALVDEAFETLGRGADAVVAPAEDGGYVLIGMRGARSELFDGIPWSGPRVLEATLERARLAGIEMTRLAPWYDVDDAMALARLRRDLGDPRHAARAPETARVLLELVLPEARLDSAGFPVV